MEALLSFWGFEKIAWLHPERVRYAFIAAGFLLVFLTCSLAAHWATVRPLLNRFPPRRERYRREWLWIGALFFAYLSVLAGGIVAAGPQEQRTTTVTEYQGACWGFAVDGSLSQRAAVSKGAKITRFEYGRRILEKFVGTLPQGDRLALMIFARKSFVFQPAWTTDRSVFFKQLSSVPLSYLSLMGRGGTNVPGAIGDWQGHFPTDDPCQKFIVVVTDGEPEGEETFLRGSMDASLAELSKAAERPATFIVAVGDSEEYIPEYDQKGEQVGFEVDDAGKFILTRPDVGYLSLLSERFRATLVYAERGESLEDKVTEAVVAARAKKSEYQRHIYVFVGRPFVILYLAALVLALFLLLLL